MNCKFKTECPSYSGWCENPKRDFSNCVSFLITAYENAKKELEDKRKTIAIMKDILDFCEKGAK